MSDLGDTFYGLSEEQQKRRRAEIRRENRAYEKQKQLEDSKRLKNKLKRVLGRWIR